MPRKRITQLLPLRTKQWLFRIYMGMRMDGNHYATTKSESLLPYFLFESCWPLYNRETGLDKVYQENKVFNLKLAAAALDQVIIRPRETFSFWRLVRYADRDTPYKDGLGVIDGKLTIAPGGGVCQMSDLLFWMFLHAPLTVVERHGHNVKDFPEPASDTPMGVDATVSKGWLDLKVKNETEDSFQILIVFGKEHIIGRLLTDRNTGQFYEVVNGSPLYYRRNNKVFEEVDVKQRTFSAAEEKYVSEKLLYRNKCEIGYPFPDGTEVIEEG